MKAIVQDRYGSFEALRAREIAKPVEEGRLRPVVDTTYALADVPAALRQIEAGHVRGRVVVTVADAGAREEDLALSA
jgi:NADPH:quinone reductase-like Zn-dependent oxidoreductase